MAGFEGEEVAVLPLVKKPMTFGHSASATAQQKPAVPQASVAGLSVAWSWQSFRGIYKAAGESISTESVPNIHK